MTNALDGIKVVEVAQVAAVPMACRHLADFGAEVIHVEHPIKGDSWRVHQTGMGQGTQGIWSDINYNWENTNRNKKSLTLDLSNESAQEILYRLVETADVFMTNLRMYERKKFNVEYDTLAKLNPRLIYGSLTGYGKKGPDVDTPAYDITAYWARAAVLHMTRSVLGGMPNGTRPAIGDTISALGLALGVMMALYARERTGVGQEVDLSLFQTGIYQISFDIAGALVTGKDYDEWRRHSYEEDPNALASPYKTKDGRWLLIIIVQPDNWWTKFCRAIEREDLEHDPRFESFEPRIENHLALHHILEEVFLSKTLDEWKIKLAGLPFAPAQNLVEVINDPQARANDFFIPIEHPTYGHMEVVANPIKLSKTPATIRMPAPEFSQHTEQILLDHGYTWEDITQFKEQGAIL